MPVPLAGAFIRPRSTFRDWVRADSDAPFPAVPGRYHLFVSLACPWAHRTIIVRYLKGLNGTIGMSIVDPIRDERGWALRDVEGATGDRSGGGFAFLAEAYEEADPNYAGRVSVPVLWDTVRRTIVNNESADIIVMLNEAWNEWALNPGLDLYPPEHRIRIDELSALIYETVNDGVYRAGFARSQEAYEHAAWAVFDTLDALEEILAERRFLTGDVQSLADWRLFPTLVRFDTVYHGHFKCNLRRIVDYPNLDRYLRDLYKTPGIAETVDMDHIKRHYYMTQPSINPSRLVPIGPDLGRLVPHGHAT